MTDGKLYEYWTTLKVQYSLFLIEFFGNFGKINNNIFTQTPYVINLNNVYLCFNRKIIFMIKNKLFLFCG